jgi:hypothetical protein
VRGYGAWGGRACVTFPERAISPHYPPLGSRCSPRGEALSLWERKGRGTVIPAFAAVKSQCPALPRNTCPRRQNRPHNPRIFAQTRGANRWRPEGGARSGACRRGTHPRRRDAPARPVGTTTGRLPPFPQGRRSRLKRRQRREAAGPGKRNRCGGRVRERPLSDYPTGVQKAPATPRQRGQD